MKNRTRTTKLNKIGQMSKAAAKAKVAELTKELAAAAESQKPTLARDLAYYMSRS